MDPLELISRGLRPTPRPHSGNLLCCGRSCRLLLAHPNCRTSSWNVFFICFVFVAFRMPKLSLYRVKIKSNCSWKAPRSSMGRPWCLNRSRLNKNMHLYFLAFFRHFLLEIWKAASHLSCFLRPSPEQCFINFLLI